ncbi:hypothetical protein [Montanilutibacter psychrotolerans]|uniref:Uncharacterized protein n=1 Tax=Montanilutibacter psychrotolerans TaxID=1327343 RepID=A0A3M8SJ96_9GAMM|nr:hypothetical protein [Lysobacter psychrotolerans]RNF81418.1 hypothetical protein EER27_16745 [Lysobacter psychrotolerans]
MSATAIQRAQDDTLAEILVWVQEVAEGRGESIAQMVVTTVLGCLPFVGQALDAYNILRSIYGLTRDPRNSEHWIELVLCLIALVPGVGDALKNVFKAMRNGKALGRILDAMPRTVRGNIERWFRELDWAAYGRQMAGSTDEILTGMVDVLDAYVVEFAMGKNGVRRLVQQLQSLKGVARQNIDEAMESLRQAHQRAIQQPLPNTTAHVSARPQAPRVAPPRSAAPAPRATPRAAPPPASRASAPAARPAPPPSPTGNNLPANTGGTATPRSGQATATQRQSQRARQSRTVTGASGEHIADYYYVKRQRARAKVSNNGTLFEMQQPGHNGIDHVWHASRLPSTYRVSDTKGTAGAFHKLETAKAVFEGLRYGIDAYLGDEDETRTRNAVGGTNSDGKQLSHRWVAKKIATARLLPAHSAALLPAIRAWERAEFQLGAQTDFENGAMNRTLVRCPYDRSLITVVGPNHNTHKRAKGATTPSCRKSVVSHQIATEFVLPNSMLRE